MQTPEMTGDRQMTETRTSAGKRTGDAAIPTGNDYVRTLLDQHYLLAQIADRIRTVTETDPALLPEIQKRRLLGELSGTMASNLQSHFHLEEEGGFLGEILDNVPQAGRHVERLRREHGDLLRLFGEIRMEAAPPLTADHGQNLPLAELEQKAADAVRRYFEHERIESKILTGAVYDETPAAD